PTRSQFRELDGLGYSHRKDIVVSGCFHRHELADSLSQKRILHRGLASHQRPLLAFDTKCMAAPEQRNDVASSRVGMDPDTDTCTRPTVCALPGWERRLRGTCILRNELGDAEVDRLAGSNLRSIDCDLDVRRCEIVIEKIET